MVSLHLLLLHRLVSILIEVDFNDGLVRRADRGFLLFGGLGISYFYSSGGDRLFSVCNPRAGCNTTIVVSVTDLAQACCSKYHFGWGSSVLFRPRNSLESSVFIFAASELLTGFEI